jgi:shikimate dehydrogenase
LGYNTDVFGFLEPLKKTGHEFDNVLILGNGGAARAVMFALKTHIKSCTINVCARNKTKSSQILQDLDIKKATISSIEDASHLLPQADLIVNTTPLGMSPDIEFKPVSIQDNLKKNTVIYDLIYNPLYTALLQEAKDNNPHITIINGLDMLVGQAAEAFRIWTGLDFPSDMVYKELEKRLKG